MYHYVHPDSVRKFVKVRFVPLIQKWHVWLMWVGGSYGIRSYDSFDQVLADFRNGSIRQWWREAFELPMSQEVIDAIDSTP